MKRTIAGTAIGNFMEWYDFGAYGFMASTIADVFFSSPKTSVRLIATFGTLAAAFIVRPLGGMFFGPLGDRIGRKRVLAVTILLMAFGTTATGLLPDYHSAGLVAPILLLLTRLVQGFSTGGEYVSAMTFIVEHSPDLRRGWLSGWLPFGTLTGYVAGASLVTGLTTGLGHDALMSWGWRVPFLLGAPLALVGLYMRMRLEEPAVFERVEQKQNVGGLGRLAQLRATLVDQWRPLLLCVGLVLTINVTNYMLTGYLPAYLSDELGVDSTHALIIVAAVLFLLLIAVTPMARLSDRIGRKPIMFAGAALLIAGAVPAFMLMRAGGGAHYLAISGGVLLLGAMLLCFNSTEPSTLPTLFPTNVRPGSLAVGYNVSVSLFGGTTPLIAESLVGLTGNTLMPAYYLIFAGLVGLVCIALTPEPARRHLPGSGPIAASQAEAPQLASS